MNRPGGFFTTFGPSRVFTGDEQETICWASVPTATLLALGSTWTWRLVFEVTWDGSGQWSITSQVGGNLIASLDFIAPTNLDEVGVLGIASATTVIYQQTGIVKSLSPVTVDSQSFAIIGTSGGVIPGAVYQGQDPDLTGQGLNQFGSGGTGGVSKLMRIDMDTAQAGDIQLIAGTLVVKPSLMEVVTP